MTSRHVTVRALNQWARHHLVPVAALSLATGGALVLPASPAAAAVNDPPGNNHSILTFPVRDFVHGDGYASSDRVTVEVLRSGAVVGTSTGLVPQDDPKTTGFDGIVEVNHPGGGCWQSVTPDLRAGDVVRMTTDSGQVDQTHVADVTVTQPATNVGGTIVEKGTAADAAGNPLPVGALQARIISNKLSYDVNGKRDIRAPGQGTLAYDAPGSTSWTATWSGLDAHDQDQAVTGESRGLWLGTDPLAVTTLGSPVEGTLFEFGQIGGPSAPCTAPLATGPTTPDLTAATDTGASSTDDVTSTTTPTFTGVTGTAPAGATVRLYVDGNVAATGTAGAGGTYSLTPSSALSDGTHVVKASEVDPTSLVETLSATGLSVTVDTAAPAPPTLRSLDPASPGSSTTPSVIGDAEARSSVALFSGAGCGTLAGGGTAATFGSTGLPVTVPAGSTTTFTATATDVAGNTSGCSSSSVTYVQDSAAPPSPTVDTAPASPSRSANPRFTFSDSEPGATFACSLTTGAAVFTPCTSPRDYANVPDGDYTFSVVARDSAGNTSPAATKALTIDTTPPSVALDTKPADPTNSSNPTFAFSSQAGSTFSCSMTTGADAFSPCSSPKTFTGLADGRYTFKVVATDPAGNTGPVTSYGVSVDTVAPGAVITGFPPDPTTDNTPAFDFTSGDPTAKLSCSLTLASAALDNYQPCTSGTPYPTRADGRYAFKVRATDPAGNTGAPDSHTFTINTVLPAPVVGLSPGSLTFPTTTPTLSSPSQTVKLSNTGNAALSIASIGIAGANPADFVQTHPTCGTSLAAGSSCTIDVVFRPTASGTRTASLQVADNGTGSPHTVTLSGTAGPADTTAPAVTAKSPAAGATTVSQGTTTTRTPVRATFSEAVTGVNGGTFTVTAGGVAVPGAVTYVASTRVATFTPDGPLTADTRYTASLTGGVVDVVGNKLAATSWSFVTGPRPGVASKSPGAGATGVAIGTTTTRTPVKVTFGEAVSGVGSSTFSLKQGATAVPATVSYDATTHVATLLPAAPLQADTTYSASLTSGITDTAGNPLTALTWSFLTGPRPTATTRTPGPNAFNVATGTAAAPTPVSATLSEAVTGVDGTTFTLQQGTATVPATVSYDAVTHVATLRPAGALAADRKYTASLTSGIKDAAGNAMTTTTWSFTTGPRPVVTTRTPASGATGVSRTANATVTFSEAVTGVSGTTFTLTRGTTPVAAVVSYNATTHVATLNPTATLPAGTTLTLALTSGIKDTAGNPLAAGKWSFKTGP